MAESNVMGEDELSSFALAMATASAPPMVLRTVIELGVLEIIKRAGPGAQLSTAEIVAQLPTENPDASTTLDRMLRVLASYEVLSCSSRSLPEGRLERLYGLAPVSRYFTKNEDGGSLDVLALLLQGQVFMESWYHLKDVVLKGGVPFNRAHSMSLYEYPNTDDKFNKLLNDAVARYSTIVMKIMLENYKGFEGLSTLVDVGGNIGRNINMIISKYPTIKGINYDLPHVIKDAPTCKGVEHIGGDMFTSIPKGGDAIFMKWILCDWDDEHCLKLLKNCYDALPNHGKVIVGDFIHPTASKTSYGSSSRAIFNIDAFALAVSVGGKLRTQQQFEALAKEAGFEEFKVVTCDIYTVMEFLKKN